jgi:hypothetical protein
MTRHTGRGRTGGGRAREPPPAIEMVREGTETLCRDSEQRHRRLPVRPSEEVTRPYASRLSQSREAGMFLRAPQRHSPRVTPASLT